MAKWLTDGPNLLRLVQLVKDFGVSFLIIKHLAMFVNIMSRRISDILITDHLAMTGACL